VVSHGKFVLPRDHSGTLKLNLGVELEKRIGLEETQRLYGFLDNVDYASLVGELNHGINHVSCLLF
jgi:hypothetical protein